MKRKLLQQEEEAREGEQLQDDLEKAADLWQSQHPGNSEFGPQVMPNAELQVWAYLSSRRPALEGQLACKQAIMTEISALLDAQNTDDFGADNVSRTVTVKSTVAQAWQRCQRAARDDQAKHLQRSVINTSGSIQECFSARTHAGMASMKMLNVLCWKSLRDSTHAGCKLIRGVSMLKDNQNKQKTEASNVHGSPPLQDYQPKVRSIDQLSESNKQVRTAPDELRLSKMVQHRSSQTEAAGKQLQDMAYDTETVQLGVRSHGQEQALRRQCCHHEGHACERQHRQRQ